MISGWCLSSDGSKISKSSNNALRPRINSYGIDILRYWVSTSNLGIDIVYNNWICSTAKRVINKLYSVNNFFNCDAHGISEFSLRKYLECNNIFCDMDKWIVSIFFQTARTINILLHNYEYCCARNSIENFFLFDFCNNYLEVIKIRIYNTSENNTRRKNSAKLTFRFVFFFLLHIL